MQRALRRRRTLRRNAVVVAFTVLAAGTGSIFFAGTAHADYQQFSYTGGAQQFVVPSGVTVIDVRAHGAAGGRNGGWGSQVYAQLPVVPGETLSVYVGGVGGDYGDPGFNGGGAGGRDWFWYNGFGGGGGGATDIRRGAGTEADRVLVAGGGGGGTSYAYGGSGDRAGGDSYYTSTGGDAGIGWYSQGRNGVATGAGGIASTSGDLLAPACANGQPGAPGLGGAGGNSAPCDSLVYGVGGGGGGGGYSGGGGGAGSDQYGSGAGGGGGSSFVDASATNVSVYHGGAYYYSGFVEISYTLSVPGRPLLPTAVPGPEPGQITVAWAPPSELGDATSVTYRVYRRLSWTGWSVVGTSSTTTFTDSGLDAAETYYYYVTAVNTYGEGGSSGETSASPYAVSEGPYTTVVPAYNGRTDQTYYKLGLRVRHGSQSYGTVEEGVLDGPLPVTTPAYPYNVTVGTDSDGDGVPGTVVLHNRTTTVSDSGGQTHTPVGTTPLPLDPNDNDDSTPRPKVVDGPYSTVTPNYNGKADQTYYKVGLRIVFAGQTYGTVQQGVLDGPLPASTPAYAYDVTVGTDADGDSVPGTLVLHNRTTTVSDTGAQTHTSTGTSALPADPNDNDDTNPRPKVVDGPYAQATPVHQGETYATHYKAGAIVRYAGQNHGRVLEGTVTPFRDIDRDFVPDESEATLCANQNSNFKSDGTCIGSDYSPPTVQGILDDLEWLP